MLKQKIKNYKSSEMVVYLIEKAFLGLMGWEVVSIERYRAYSGSKGFLLGLIFLPLALLGNSTYFRVTFERKKKNDGNNIR